jgi:ankyrin repeat protein
MSKDEIYKRFIGLNTLTELLSNEHPNIKKLYNNIKTANDTNNVLNKKHKLQRIQKNINSKLQPELRHQLINIYINTKDYDGLTSYLIYKNSEIPYVIEILINKHDNDGLKKLIVNLPLFKSNFLNFIQIQIKDKSKNLKTIELLRILKSIPGPDIINEQYNDTTFMLTAARYSNDEIIIELKNLGADVNKGDIYGKTPYNAAANLKTQAILVGLGAAPSNTYDIELLNKLTGRVVIFNDNNDTIGWLYQIIIDMVLKIFKPYNKPLLPSPFDTNKNVRSFLDSLDIPYIYKKKIANDIKNSTKLFKQNSFSNILSKYSLPPSNIRTDTFTSDDLDKIKIYFMTAIDSNELDFDSKIKIINLLLILYKKLPDSYRKHPEKFLNVNVKDKDGRSLLHWAILTNNTIIMYILCKLGVDQYIKDNDGKYPSDYLNLSEKKIEEIFDKYTNKGNSYDRVLSIEPFTKEMFGQCNSDLNTTISPTYTTSNFKNTYTMSNGNINSVESKVLNIDVMTIINDIQLFIEEKNNSSNRRSILTDIYNKIIEKKGILIPNNTNEYGLLNIPELLSKQFQNIKNIKSNIPNIKVKEFLNNLIDIYDLLPPERKSIPYIKKYDIIYVYTPPRRGSINIPVTKPNTQTSAELGHGFGGGKRRTRKRSNKTRSKRNRRTTRK